MKKYILFIVCIGCLIALLAASEASASTMKLGKHFVDQKTGYPCEVWRENNGGAPEDVQYCQGEFDAQQRLYELENIVKEQEKTISALSMNLQPGSLIGSAVEMAKTPPPPTMSPEMKELFAAFESRLQKVEKLVEIIIKALSTIPTLKTLLMAS